MSLELSQAKLGSVLGRSQRWVSSIERGRTLPATCLFPIAHALKIDARLLVEKPLPDLEG
ncbi:MAG: hypothetical protein KME42_14195 [Tildeniella nuda ZEHNDER 1965/U140]|nr:hypothetical protein [Tildeniella nuda ZEHNDER 1965/U140]